MKRKESKKNAPIPKVKPNTVSGIDALIYHCKIDYNDYSYFFNNVLLKRQLEDDKSLQIRENVDYTKQYSYFDFYYVSPSERKLGGALNLESIPLCCISFKNLNQRDNLDSIKVDISSVYLQVLTIQEIHNIIQEKLFEFNLKIEDTKVNRIDLNTYVYGFDMSWINPDFISTNARKLNSITNSLFSSSKMSTFTVGSRDTGSVYLRIYNKWNELINLSRSKYNLANIKQTLIELKFCNLGLVIDTKTPLWNVEFEIKRGKLKQYNINTIEDLDIYINSFHNILMSKYVKLLSTSTFDGDTNKNKIALHQIWNIIKDNYNYNNKDLVPIDKIPDIIYKHNDTWLTNRLEEYLSELKNDDINKRDLVKQLISILD